MASLHGQWNLFYDMTNRKSVSGKTLHIQQRDNGTSLCGRDDNYGLPISFPVSAPICGKCLEIKANVQAETIESLQEDLDYETGRANRATDVIASLQAEIESLKAVIQDSKAYERVLTDGVDETGEADSEFDESMLYTWHIEIEHYPFFNASTGEDGFYRFEIASDCGEIIKGVDYVDELDAIEAMHELNKKTHEYLQSHASVESE